MMSWSEYPLFRPAFLFICGILAQSFYSIPIYTVLVLWAGLFLFAWLCALQKAYDTSERYTYSMVVFLVIFCAGYSIASIHNASDPYHYSTFIHQGKNDVVLTVLTEPKKGKTYSYPIKISGLNGRAVRGRAMLYTKTSIEEEAFHPGDVLLLNAYINPIKENTNPHAFDYKQFLAYRGIGYSIYAEAKDAKILDTGSLGAFMQSVWEVRKWALRRLKIALPDEEHYAIAAAMILGDRSLISEDLKRAYTETGAIHVLAVSGLHVGIVCALFLFLFRHLGIKNRYAKAIKVSVIIIILWCYAILTGMAPAVTRAALMFSLILLGDTFFRYQNSYNTLAGAAIIILMIDPNLLFQISFQFSFLALISILFFFRRIYYYCITDSKPLNYVLQLASMSVAAQVLVFPLTIYYFHKFPIYFILSGIVAVGLAFFILYLGIATILLSSIPIISTALNAALSVLMSGFVDTIYRIHDLPYGLITGVWWDVPTIMMIYVMILIFMAMIKFGLKAQYVIPILLLGIIHQGYSIYQEVYAPKRDSIVVYDAGNTYSLVDIYEDRQGYTLSSPDIKQKTISYSAQNNRIFNAPFTMDSIRLLDGIYIAKDVSFYIPSRNIREEIAPQATDFLIICDHYEKPPQFVLKYHTPEMVILDHTIDYRWRRRWHNYLDKEAMPYHDIHENGAFLAHF